MIDVHIQMKLVFDDETYVDGDGEQLPRWSGHAVYPTTPDVLGVWSEEVLGNVRGIVYAALGNFIRPPDGCRFIVHWEQCRRADLPIRKKK